MTIKPVLRFALVLISASIWVLPAFAACNPPKSLSSYNFVTGAYSYMHTSLTAPLTLNASIWSGSTDHTGTCNETSGILYFGAAPGDIGISLSLGDACVPGCPTGALSIQASASDGTRSQTLVAQAPETPGGAVNFDFSATGPRDLGEYPRPQVTSLSRVGSLVHMTISIPPVFVYDGAGSGITGFNILNATANSDPGRDAGAYTFNSFLASPGGGGAVGMVTGQCPAGPPDDVWMVTQIKTAAGAGRLVSQALRVRCWILAEPTRRIDKKMGTRTDN
jgi:hypothetical protein